MTTQPKGHDFWHCRHQFDGLPLLTFGRTQQLAQKRMISYVAILIYQQYNGSRSTHGSINIDG